MNKLIILNILFSLIILNVIGCENANQRTISDLAGSKTINKHVAIVNGKPLMCSDRAIPDALEGHKAVANRKRLIRPDFTTFETNETPTKETTGKYILQIGDRVDIKFFYNPELNELVTIRPDGRISLQLIDEVMAAGLAPSELDELLTELYSNRLDNAEVAVIVREFPGLNVYVGGEVNSPGLIPVAGKLTTLQAILHAGGFKDTAESKSVVILRNQGTQDPLFMTLNLKENLVKGVAQNDILLKPYDIIFVPKSTIAKMNQFVDQYIKELIPVTLSFGLVYNLNPEYEVK